MDKKELLSKIEELEAKVAELKAEANKPERHKYGQVFVPKINDTYWYCASTDLAFDCNYTDSLQDKAQLSIGNCYRTKQDADRELERRKITHELQVLAGDFVTDWNDRQQVKYFIGGYNYNHKELELQYYYNLCCSAIPAYFRSIEALKAAIKAVGKKRIIRAFFEADYKGE